MKIAKSRSVWLAACLGAAALGARAQPPAQPGQPGQAAQPAAAVQPAQSAPPGAPARPFLEPPIFPGLPTVPLQPLLDRVARTAKKQFLVDGRISPEIYLAGAHQEDVTYPVLLSILRANGLASVELEGKVNVVPAQDARFLATPIVQNDSSGIAADEFVTRILTTTNVDSAQLVPILRPLMPQAAHLAAMPPNQLILMDRYANVQRITAIVRALDQPGGGRRRE